MEQGKYNLRTRPAPSSGSRPVRIRPGSPVSSEQDSVEGVAPGAGQRTYSDVVASRPASPARKSGDKLVVPPGRRNARADSEANDSVHKEQDTTFIINKVVKRPASVSESTSENENRYEWTTVQCRCARSAEPTPTRRN